MRFNKKVFTSAALILMLITASVISGCEVSVTTANFSDIKTASQINAETMEPVTVTDTFTPESPVVYVTGTVNNAPEGTKVKAEWIYTDEDFLIAEVGLDIEQVTQSFNFNLTRPDNGFPTGSYEVKLYIDDEYKESANFKVN